MKPGIIKESKRVFHPNGRIFAAQYTWQHVYVFSENRNGKLIAIFNIKVLKK